MRKLWSLFHVKHRHNEILLFCLLGTILAMVSCSLNSPMPTIAFNDNQPTAISTSTIQPSPTILTPTLIPQVTPSPTLPNPYRLLSMQLAQLGNPSETFAAKRQVVLERFEHGVMFIFAQAGNVFAQNGGGYVFALATDGRAWRVKDTFVETSKNPDDWYTCDRKPGLRPERSGIPWRGFGKVWCDNADIRAALGNTKIYEDVDPDASFQSYEHGFAFQLADWKGYPGWKSDKVYVVYYSVGTNPNLITGKWE